MMIRRSFLKALGMGAIALSAGINRLANGRSAQQVLPQDLGFEGTIFKRRLVFEKAGDYQQQHSHKFWHTTFVAKGRIHFVCPVTGVDRVIEGPDFIETPPNAEHLLTAMEDDCVAFCVFSGRTFQGELADTPDEIEKDPFKVGDNYR